MKPQFKQKKWNCSGVLRIVWNLSLEIVELYTLVMNYKYSFRLEFLSLKFNQSVWPIIIIGSEDR